MILVVFLLVQQVFLYASLLECPKGLELKCDCESFSECCSCVPKEIELCGENLLLVCTGEVMTRRCCRCIEECPYGYSTHFHDQCVLECVPGNGTHPCCKCIDDDISSDMISCPEGYLNNPLCDYNEVLDCVQDGSSCCRCFSMDRNKKNDDDEDLVIDDSFGQTQEETNDKTDDDSISSSENSSTNENDENQRINEDEIKESKSNIDDSIQQQYDDYEEEKVPGKHVKKIELECPNGYHKNLDTCPSNNLLEVECISNHPECCRCVARRCPTGYTFHSMFENCDETVGWENECQFFESPYSNICCRCKSRPCPDQAYPNPSDSLDCATGTVKKCDSNFSGGKSCCGCIHPECPTGDYSTSIRQCGIGYKKECKGFHDRKRCCRCVPKLCESGYTTNIKTCQIGYKTCSGHSGESSCCRCNTGLTKDGKNLESYCPDGYIDIDLFLFNNNNNNNKKNNNQNDQNHHFCGIGEFTECLNENTDLEKQDQDLEDWEDYSSCCRCSKICPDGFSTDIIKCGEKECILPEDSFLSLFNSDGDNINNRLRIEDAKFCCKCKI